ncbi:MAG: AMP-binding protein [Eggerthellaceae bacterium]|nr:AMP-binding protein [Eggerthellaceae bacterium]
MIDIFESTARMYPNRVFFTCVDASGSETVYTYRVARLKASALARRLRDTGVREGDYVVVDLPNCAAFVLLALAAGYGSFTLALINNRLSAAEKKSRLAELENCGKRIGAHIGASEAARLIDWVDSFLASGDTQDGKSEQVSSRGFETGKPSLFGGARSAGFGKFSGSNAASRAHQRGNAEFVLRQKRHRPIMGAREDALSETIHFAEREAHLFDIGRSALVMFTSGTTGKPKAVQLTWYQLASSAQAANRALGAEAGFWQASLPLYHVGGFQIVVRSVQARRPFVLYERFDAQRILRDASRFGATHLSVVDKMLQDLLAVDELGALSSYRCILLGGGPLNDQTLERAVDAKARVYASYGMTETSSMIASSLVEDGFQDRRVGVGLRLAPGYEARIVDPDANGFGRLAVRGPGVFSGYLNARAARTIDGYFLTGDTAALEDGNLILRERTGDMFISGGENVYPAEIAAVLRRIPGIAEAHVFGVADPKWGRRPVAIVERAPLSSLAAGPRLAAPEVRDQLAESLSKLNMPEYICFVDEMPRSGIGKTDRAATELLFEQRIQVERVILHRFRLPFTKPFKTAKETLTHREGIVVEIVDHEGRRGLGECVSFETDWYLPETLDQDWPALENIIAPLVKSEAFLHPREVSRLLSSVPELAALPMACAAVENAVWDLYGHIVGQPLWQLLRDEYARVEQCMLNDLSALSDAGIVRLVGRKHTTSALVTGERAMVPAGAVVAIGKPGEVLESARACVASGYRRVKLKLSPGQGVGCVRVIRNAFPQLLVTLDANQSFSMHRASELQELDRLDVGWIEEPLAAPWGMPSVGRPAFERLARFQDDIATPICVDESYVNAEQALEMLGFEELRCICVKIGKFGGAQPALEFVCLAQLLGREVWMGGMYDTGVSKRLHAAFQALPGLVVPGDIGSTSRYFAHDITLPSYETSHGYVALNSYGFETGLGCSLNKEILKQVRISRCEI